MFAFVWILMFACIAEADIIVLDFSGQRLIHRWCYGWVLMLDAQGRVELQSVWVQEDISIDVRSSEGRPRLQSADPAMMLLSILYAIKLRRRQMLCWLGNFTKLRIKQSTRYTMFWASAKWHQCKCVGLFLIPQFSSGFSIFFQTSKTTAVGYAKLSLGVFKSVIAKYAHVMNYNGLPFHMVSTLTLHMFLWKASETPDQEINHSRKFWKWINN